MRNAPISETINLFRNDKINLVRLTCTAFHELEATQAQHMTCTSYEACMQASNATYTNYVCTPT